LDDGAGVDFLSGDEGKALGEVEAKLSPENSDGARASTVLTNFSRLSDVTEEVEIRLHGVSLFLECLLLQ